MDQTLTPYPLRRDAAPRSVWPAGLTLLRGDPEDADEDDEEDFCICGYADRKDCVKCSNWRNA